jgi:hypothetical protein
LHLPCSPRQFYCQNSTSNSRLDGLEPQARGSGNAPRPTPRGISGQHVCILAARDRNGRTLDFAAGCGPLTKAGLSHEAVNLRVGVRNWLHRFHGVSTRYLPNYLGWRCILDACRIDTRKAGSKRQ